MDESCVHREEGLEHVAACQDPVPQEVVIPTKTPDQMHKNAGRRLKNL